MEIQNTARRDGRGRRPLVLLTTALALFASAGATCNRPMMRPFGSYGPSAPHVLVPGATTDQIVAAVNQNSARVVSIFAPNASITVPGSVGLPLLRGQLAAQQPRLFRLTAGTGVTGQEIDLGSNDELFWIWVKRNDPPAIYFARHDQFLGSAACQVMPIDPSWLLSAVGMVHIDPGSVFQGPTPHGRNAFELRTTLTTPTGTFQRVLVVDAARAWVLQQHVYDASGTTLIASATTDSFRYYPEAQVSLPERVTLHLPANDLKITIDLGEVMVNQLAGDPQQLWTMPVMPGYQHVDLGNSQPTGPLTYGPPPGAPAPSTPWQPAPAYPAQ